MPVVSKPAWDTPDVERIKHLYAQGLSATVIAKRVGVVISSVYCTLKKAGLNTVQDKPYKPEGDCAVVSAGKRSNPHFIEHYNGPGSS
jgi:hypothetical protein